MAIATLTPDAGAAPARIEDPVTFKEAQAQFQAAGVDLHWKTLERWAKVDGLPTGRRGRAVTVSYSDLLEAELRRSSAAGR